MSSSPELIDMPGAFSEYGAPYEDLPLQTVVIEGSELIAAGLVDRNTGRFVDIYSVDGYEYKVINDNRG